ncbi:MAG: DUF1295 domain-containing protein [Candidatus Bipolaricaulota bacterium]
MLSRDETKAMAAIPVALAVAAAVAWAGSAGGRTILGFPVFAVLFAMAFLIQWVVFVPSFLLRSERFFDVTGSLTYVSVMALAVAWSPPVDARSALLLALVVVWAARLGTFLLRRVRRAGKDARFDQIKGSFWRLLLTWTLQGLWVSLTLAAGTAAITAGTRRPLGIPEALGLGVWLIGFGLEALADEQKRRFQLVSANRGEFIRTGLWGRSRHPNYLGEILLWTGVAAISAPVLRGWQWVTMVSPAFVALLLTRISGIPILEKRADKKWGGREDYETYKRNTPVLLPRLWKRQG